MLNKTTILTTIFTIIDDAMKASKQLTNLRTRGPQPGFSDAEVITLALYQEFIREPREKQFFKVHHEVLSGFFPRLIERSRYNRRKKDLWKVMLSVRVSLLVALKAFSETSAIIDSAPVPCVAYKRGKKHTKFHEADYGYCSSKVMKYFGYKCHSLVTLTGVIIDFMLSSARPHDHEAVVELVGKQKEILSHLFGDKGYNDEDLKEYLLTHMGIDLHSPRKINQKQVESQTEIKAQNRIRLIIETVHAQLQEQFSLSKHYAKSQWGAFTRIAAKITAHTLGIFINQMLGRPSLALADLAA